MPDTITLDNGLRLVVTPMPHARSVAISVYLAAGSRYEVQADAGLWHFVEHLCFKGTERRPRAQEIAIEIDSLGGGINAATDREFTIYYARVTPQQAARTLDLIADVLRHSLFQEAEVERERGVILEELASVEDSPAEQSGILLDGLLWPGQPQGRDIAGTPETVAALGRERLLEAYRRQYVPNAAVVSVAGAIDVPAATALVQDALGGWEPGQPTDWLRAEQEPRGDRDCVIAKETEQAHLSIGFRGLALEDESRPALDLLSLLLGEGMSSRLFTRLREELGLCYDIHTYVSCLRDSGMFGLYAGVDPAKASEAVSEIANELRRVRESVDEEELARALEIARSRLLLRMDDSRSVSAWYGGRLALDLPPAEPEDEIARLEAVTAADVRGIARRLLTDGELHLAAVGPLAGTDLFAGVSVGD